MTDPAGNTLSDFPPEEFTILAFCESCGHQGAVDRAAFPEAQIVQDLPGRLRCSACGARECNFRIVFTGAGGYRHG
jgi:hypothetical protein